MTSSWLTNAECLTKLDKKNRALRKSAINFSLRADVSRDAAERVVLAEQRQDRLRRGVGDRQRLDSQLLLRLQGGQLARFFFHVGVNQLANTRGDGVAQ